MKIKLSDRFITSSGNILDPGGTPEFPELDLLPDLFSLDLFEATLNPVPPMMDNTISWQISVIDPATVIENYEFRLNVFGHVSDQIIEPAGSVDIFQTSPTLAVISVRRKNSGGRWQSFGQTLRVSLDSSNCQSIEFPGVLLEFAVIENLKAALSRYPKMRFKAGKETQVDWTTQRIRFKFPLEIVIENFFNADFTLEMEVSFDVDPQPGGSSISVDVDFDSDVNFHWLEDIGSIGSSLIIARTLNKFMPMLLDCLSGGIEADILEAIMDDRVGRALAETPGADIFQILIVPSPNNRNNAVNVIICPTAASQPADGVMAPSGPNRLLILPL